MSLAAQIAQRDGKVRELRTERDSVMASVRQRDAALQVWLLPEKLPSLLLLCTQLESPAPAFPGACAWVAMLKVERVHPFWG